jgi:hypothetical protein
MQNMQDIRRSALQKLRDLFPKASGWNEERAPHAGGQPADVVVKLRMGETAKTLLVTSTALGQPRHLRDAMTRLGELEREFPAAFGVVAAPYVSPHGAALLRRSGLGYIDLSGNCYLAFDNVLIEKEGKPNLRPSTRPLKSLFAPRATRVARVLLVDPQHAWRLEELAKAAEVSLGHAHNVVRRLEELGWLERGEHQRIHLARPGELLDGWVEAYTYRVNAVETYFSPERVTRRLIGETARAIQGDGRRYAFTMHSGASLVAPTARVPAIHCYVEGSPEPIARTLGLRPAEGPDGNVHLMAPYDQGVLYAPVVKGGVPVVCLPQLYADLFHYDRRGREQARHLRRQAMGY